MVKLAITIMTETNLWARAASDARFESLNEI